MPYDNNFHRTSNRNNDHTARYNGSRPPMKPKILSENRQEAMMQLFDCRNHVATKVKIKKEIPIFTLYSTYAWNNIQEQINIDDLNKKAKVKFGDTKFSLEDKLNLADDAAIRRLANFLWLFQFDDPYLAFSGEYDYRKCAVNLVVQIEKLRNYFAHPGMSGIEPLLTGTSLYRFLEGVLRPNAEREAERPGMQTEKLFKIKLMNPHERGVSYEFTRRGLIFLISLALYRDQAIEFLQQFEDLSLPERCADADCADNPECGKTCKVGRVKAFQTAFTYYSIRRGRQAADLEEAKFVTFADIIGYLNKVPKIAYETLSLDTENQKMDTLNAESAESEENKTTKYRLQCRFRNRFLQFAAAYCEDYDIFPDLHFKRLYLEDGIIPGNAGNAPESRRSRFCFGKENDNRCRMDRHYAITHDAVNFEFRPKEHYGDIKINALRSRLSSGQLKQLLALNEKSKGKEINDFLADYFSAYHKLLERLLNTKDCDEISMDYFYDELKTILGVSDDDLDAVEYLDDMERLAGQYLPKSLSRFFIPDDFIPEVESLRKDMLWKLDTYIMNNKEFLDSIRALNDWKAQRKEYNKKLEAGIADDENIPPIMPLRCKKLNDGTLISKVFNLFNLYLSPDKRFRQIPLGEQHRGPEDYEYQLVHKMIGKFALDPTGLWSYMEKHHPELGTICAELKKETNKLYSKEKLKLEKNPQFSKDGKPIRATKSLTMLATAAVNLHIVRCGEIKRKWEKSVPADQENDFRTDCRIFHVRQGMPLDRQSLVKTILHVDETLWHKAYDYRKCENHFNRTLDKEEHVVSQIPVPNELMERCADTLLKENKGFAWCFDGNKFDFNKKDPSGKQSETFMDRCFACKNAELRDFYDTTPLQNILKAKETSAVMKSGLNPAMAQMQLSRSQLKKRAGDIRDVELQDKLLLLIALKYREKFTDETKFFDNEKILFGTSRNVYDFYNTEIIWKKDKITIRGTLNDILRPSLNKILKLKSLKPLLRIIGEDVKECTFYQLLDALRRVESADRGKRLEIIPKLIVFEAKVSIDEMMYVGKSKEEITEMEFKTYKKVFPELTMEDYLILSTIRNKVFHRELELDTEQAMTILKKYV